jgi:preprotein translocase subunit YajC
MFISKAFAEETAVVADAAAQAAATPPAGSPVMWNMGLIAVMVIMFYVLLIRPQQKRFKEHADMLGALKKGDKVVTAGGLVGVIEKIDDKDDEVIVDLGGGMKVTALRHTIQAKAEKKDDAKK